MSVLRGGRRLCPLGAPVRLNFSAPSSAPKAPCWGLWGGRWDYYSRFRRPRGRTVPDCPSLSLCQRAWLHGSTRSPAASSSDSRSRQQTPHPAAPGGRRSQTTAIGLAILWHQSKPSRGGGTGSGGLGGQPQGTRRERALRSRGCGHGQVRGSLGTLRGPLCPGNGLGERGQVSEGSVAPAGSAGGTGASRQQGCRSSEGGPASLCTLPGASARLEVPPVPPY